MKILITGANGFLGHYLTAQLLQRNIEVVATGKGNCLLPFSGAANFVYAPMDFTDAENIMAVFNQHKPTVVVHAGAMSKPDECEENKEATWLVNVTGTANMLAAAEKYNCTFIYISTDFVFDGAKGMYTETDEPNPVNYYGQTKLEAEKLVQQYNGSWAIVRTVLVYGKPLSGRNNILTIVKEKLEKGEEYKVVSDQIRTPTYVEDLGAGIISIIEKNKTGIWHLSGADILTPYDMACAAADYLQLNKNLLQEVTAATFNQPAMRPPKTGFVLNKAKKELGYLPIPFNEGLRKTFDNGEATFLPVSRG
jgi:dTDP-4-dehydrorhamnose reductase